MSVVVITGIQAAGKSTVAQRLAETFPRSVHVRGDGFRRMVVNGRVDMSVPDPQPEAVAQLQLRYRLAARTASAYADAGFTAVLQDVAIGPSLTVLLDAVTARPLHLVVLAPSQASVAARDAERQRARGKVAYRPGQLELEGLDAVLRQETPRLGYWLDSSEQTVEETVADIRAHLDGAALIAR